VPVEVTHHPVVRKNLQLVGREEDAEETNCILPFRHGSDLPPSFAADPRGACAAVVAVGHIGERNFRKFLRKRTILAHPPERMPDPVGRHKIHDRWQRGFRSHKRVDFRTSTVGQENRSGIRTQSSDQACPVVFLSFRVFSCFRMISFS